VREFIQVTIESEHETALSPARAMAAAHVLDGQEHLLAILADAHAARSVSLSVSWWGEGLPSVTLRMVT
jgi:hypothetical protein